MFELPGTKTKELKVDRAYAEKRMLDADPQALRVA
jgi:hypothetical protein